MVAFQTLLQNEYFQSFLILLGTTIIAQIFNIIFKKYAKKFTEKTKTDIDDTILKVTTKPLYILIVFIGLYFALKSLSILASYALWTDRLFFVVSVLIVSLLASRVLSILVSRWFKVQKKFEKTPKLINKIITVIIYLIAILMILSHFEIEITPLIATLGVGGLAVGLALQSTLSNFFSGLYMVADKPINVGDFIELPDTHISGYVEDIGWRSTRIKTLPNTIVIIPNSKLAENIIVNNSLPEQEMSALVQCGVDYGSDLKKVEKITVDAARKVQKTAAGAVKSFEPLMRYHAFGDSNINFTVTLRVEKFEDKFHVVHEFIKALKEGYDKEKIEISWPVRKIYHGK